MPVNLHVGENYTLRVTAVDATTGAVVSGVKIDTVVITAEAVAPGGDLSGLEVGPWMFVPEQVT